MQMVELILQGVKGFPSQTRIALAPGKTVVRAASAASLWPALEALLYVDGRSPGELSLDPGIDEVCRAAITLRAADGTIWRVVRDLRGATALQRLDPAGKFEKIASNPKEIGPYLRTQVGLPSRSLFEELFTLGAGDFPAARAAAAEQGAGAAALGHGGFPGLATGGLQGGMLGGGASAGRLQGGLRGGFPYVATGALPGVPGGLPGALAGGLGGGLQGGLQPAGHTGILSALAMEPPAPPPARRPAEELIPELERELARAEELEEIQRRFDSSQSRLFELEEMLKAIPRAEEASAAADRELSRFSVSPPIQGDLVEELASFHRAAARREAALARIEDDREALDELSAGPMPTPVWEDRRFWGAAALGAVFLTAAIFTRWKAMALLAIPSFGASAIFAYAYAAALQGRERYGRRKALFTERENKVVKEHEAETAAIFEAIRTVGVETPGELEGWIGARRKARAHAAEAARLLSELQSDPELVAAVEERQGVAAEVTALETELSTKAAAAYRSAAEIRRELDLLRSERGQALTGAGEEAYGAVGGGFAVGGVAESFSGGMDGGAFGGLGGGQPIGAAAPLGAGEFGGLASSQPSGMPRGDDPSARLLEKMEELFHVPRDGLLASFGSRASKYLEALTGRRYTSLSWGSSGGLRCAGAEGTAHFLELAPRHQDVAWLALRLTVIEHYVGRYPLPVILDEPFLSLSEQRQALISRMLNGIAAKTQIVHRTGLEVMASGATTLEIG